MGVATIVDYISSTIIISTMRISFTFQCILILASISMIVSARERAWVKTNSRYDCQQICKLAVGCHFWTWAKAGPWFKHCRLSTSAGWSLSVAKTAVSGSKDGHSVWDDRTISGSDLYIGTTI